MSRVSLCKEKKKATTLLRSESHFGEKSSFCFVLVGPFGTFRWRWLESSFEEIPGFLTLIVNQNQRSDLTSGLG